MSKAALDSVEYRCSDLCWCYLQQTVHFFQSDLHAIIPHKLAFPVSTARSPILHWRLWSYKPLHKHDSNKHQSKACNLRPQIRSNQICDACKQSLPGLTDVSRVLSNQHYQHCSNQKLHLWANAVFQNCGACAGKSFLYSPPPPSLFLFFAPIPRRKRLLHMLSKWCRFLPPRGREAGLTQPIFGYKWATEGLKPNPV